jgi:hypothetical protein
MSNGNPAETPPSGGATLALWVVAIAAILFWLAITVSIFGWAIAAGGPAAAWGACFLFALILLVLAGREINGRWWGVLIDARNKYSLARLQIIIWTVMVMTAYLTFALPRIRLMAQGTLTQAEALNIMFPKELILAMGISAVSFAGSSLIKRTKTSKTTTIDLKNTSDATRIRRDQAKTDLAIANSQLQTAVQNQKTKEEELAAAKADLAAATDDASRKVAQARVDMAETLLKAAKQDSAKATKDSEAKKAVLEAAEKDFVAATEAEGLLHRNASPAEASWVDLVRGEEIGNYKLVDMSKVQMLFFTVVVVATYAGAIIALLYNVTYMQKPPAELAFPEFSETLNALLGISHGTYLSVKAVDHS